MNCLYCGSPAVDETGHCHECGLNQCILYKAYNTSNYYYNLGLDRAKIRDLSGAIEVLKLSLKYNKRNTNARNLLGLVYYDMGEWVLALSQWVISTNYDSNKKNAANKYIKQLQANSIKLDSNSRMANTYNRALLLAASGAEDLPFIQLRRILKTNPHFVKGFLMLGLIHIKMEEYGKAGKCFRRVLKIDRFNPTAIRLLKEMDLPEEDYDEDDIEDIYQAEIGGDSEKLDIGELLENSKQDEEDDSEDGIKFRGFKEVNFAKYALVYVIVGIVLGISTMTFLVMPSRVNSVRAEYSDIKLTFSDEIAKKNASISDSQAKLESANQQVEKLKKQLEEATEADGSNSIYDKLFDANELLASEKVKDAILKLEDVEIDELTSEGAKKLYRSVMDAGKGDIYDTFMADGQKALEDSDITSAIRYLTLASKIDDTKAKPLFFLAKAYETDGNATKANEIRDYIDEHFPDSKYANGGVAAGDGEDAEDADEDSDNRDQEDGGAGDETDEADGEGDAEAGDADGGAEDNEGEDNED